MNQSGNAQSLPVVIEMCDQWRALPRLLTGVSARGPLHNGGVFSKGSCQVDQMILFMLQNLADVFGHGVFSQTLAVTDPFTITSNGCHFVLEIESKHLLRLYRYPNRFRLDRRQASEIVDLF